MHTLIFLKNKHLYIIFISSFILSFFISGCKKNKNANEDIKVFSKDKIIKIFEGNCTFKEILKDTRFDDLEYIQNYDKIFIEIPENHYDNITVTEYILNTTGEYKYLSKNEGTELELEQEDNTISFKIKPNFITMFSSNGEDYDKGKTIKGYSLKCKKNDTIKNYSFVIKGDAAIVNIETPMQ